MTAEIHEIGNKFRMKIKDQLFWTLSELNIKDVYNISKQSHTHKPGLSKQISNWSLLLGSTNLEYTSEVQLTLKPIHVPREIRCIEIRIDLSMKVQDTLIVGKSMKVRIFPVYVHKWDVLDYDGEDLEIVLNIEILKIWVQNNEINRIGSLE